MKKPGIEKEFKKNGNLISGCGAFLGVGIGAVAATTMSPLFMVMTVGAMTPLLTDVIGIKLLVSKKGFVHKTSFLYKPFKKMMKKWIDNYIENSDSLTEKKYKVACLSLWVQHKELDLNQIGDLSMFRALSEELDAKNERKAIFPLFHMFYKDQLDTKNQYGVEATIDSFLNADKYEPEKIEIAKKVYSEYSNLGIAAENFLNRNNFEGPLKLQDYKLTPQDYEVIKQYKGPNLKALMDSTKLYSQEAVDTMKKIIDVEDNTDNLKILQNYCVSISMQVQGFTRIPTNFNIFPKIIETKISYLKLHKELPHKDNDSSPITKRKIKI
jgi:hypothetical protein